MSRLVVEFGVPFDVNVTFEDGSQQSIRTTFYANLRSPEDRATIMNDVFNHVLPENNITTFKHFEVNGLFARFVDFK